MNLQKKSVLQFASILLILGFGFNVFSQDVKLGLPVGHMSYVYNAEFSPDNQLIATSSLENTSRIWDANSGKLIHILSGHKDNIRSAKFNSTGQRIITASDDSTAKIWDVFSGKLLFTLKGHEEVVVDAEFSPDGKLIATTSLDGSIIIWDCENGIRLKTLYQNQEFHANEINISSDSKYLLSDHTDGYSRVLDIKTGEILMTLEANQAKFSKNSKYVFACTNQNGALFSLKTKKILFTTALHSGYINDFDFSADDNLILTASEDSSLFVWNVKEKKLEKQIKFTASFKTARFNQLNNTIVSGLSDGQIVIWDVTSGALKEIYSINNLNMDVDLKVGIDNICVSSDGKTILFTSAAFAVADFEMNKVLVFDAILNEEKFFLNGRTSTIEAVSLSHDGGFLAMRLENRLLDRNDGSIPSEMAPLYEINNAKFIKNLSEDGRIATTTSFISKENDVLVSYENGTGLFVDIDKNTSNFKINESFFDVTFSPDGNIYVNCQYWIGNCSNQRKADSLKVLIRHLKEKYPEKMINAKKIIFPQEFSIYLIEIETNTTCELIHDQKIGNVKISPDGRYVASAGEKTIYLWQLDNKELIRKISGHHGEITSLVFSNDSRMLASNSWDNTTRIWEVPSGNQYKILNIRSQTTEFSNDNNKVLIWTADGTAEIREVSTGKLINILDGAPLGISSTFFIQNSGRVLTTSRDGSWSIWDTQSGNQLISNYIFDSDPNKWVHVHPSGLFDASPEAMELMYWTKGLEVIGFAQLKDRYWVPGLWEKVMKGEPLPDVRDMKELKLQPEVELGEIKDGKIPVTLSKREGGFGKVSILINGKEVQADARGSNFDKNKETQTIWVDLKDHPNLKDGENTIAVKASSEDGFVVGRPEEKKVTLSLQRTAPHFYALVVGTGKYMNSSINLKYPEKDATSMSTALKLGAEELFGADKTHIYTLTTAGAERPTKEKIKSVFTEIGKKATSSDIILVYLSGHGIAWGGDQGDFYYVTTDATAANTDAYNDEALRKNYTISTTEFTEYLKAIPANKQVMIIDACSSGKAVDNLMAARDIDVSSIKAIDRMKDRTGMFVISGSAADAVSYEASRYGQGLLTYSILQAMKGAALRDGQFFDVNTILNYSRENVPKLAAGIGGIQTPQLLIPKGGSFDIGRADEEVKKQIPLSSIKPVFVRTVVFDDNSDDDDLNISKLLDEELNEIAMRGTDAQIVFLDIREFPEAYRLRGSYTQANGTITLKLKIKGPKESEYQLSAKTNEELLEKVLEIVEGLE